MNTPTRSTEQGMAMMILLIAAAAIAVLTVAMGETVMQESQISMNYRNTLRARFVAEAGMAAGAGALSQNLNWTGPQSGVVGNGTYTVQVDPNVSTSTVKVLASTGEIGVDGYAGARQTVRAAFALLPRYFSTLSDDIILIHNHNSLPGVSDPYTMQAMHANNRNKQGVAISIPDGTTINGRITASSGLIRIDPDATCNGCSPATNQPLIPFPTYDWDYYRAKAQAAGQYFTSGTALNTWLAARPKDANGYNLASGTIFVEATSISLGTSSMKIRLNGTLAVYKLNRGVPTGDIDWNSLDYIQVAPNGEPAVLAGGDVTSSNNHIEITGLLYGLGTYHLHVGQTRCGSSTETCVRIIGALQMKGKIHYDGSEIRYDPNVLGASQGLSAPIVPISWYGGR